MRGRRECDRSAKPQLGCPRRGQRGREQRRMAALGVARDDDPLRQLPGRERARRARRVEHAAALGEAEQEVMHARRAEALVVRPDHGVAGLQPASQQRVRVAREVVGVIAAARCAAIGRAGGAMGVGDQRPAALRRLPLGQRERAGDDDVLTGDAGRSIEEQFVARRTLEGVGSRVLARPDERTVLARRLRRRRVEGRALRPGPDLGGGWSREDGGREEQDEGDAGSAHGAHATCAGGLLRRRPDGDAPAAAGQGRRRI